MADALVRAFLDALAANDPARAPLAPNARYTENGQELAVGKGLWAVATGVSPVDYALVEDTELGNVCWLGVVEENGRPVVVFARLHARDGLIDEIELVVRREAPRVFDPQNMTEPRAVLFEEVPQDERSSREELARIGNSYFDAIEQARGDAVPVTDECVRVECGTQTTRVEDVSAYEGTPAAHIFRLGVREQLDSGFFRFIEEIRDRRVVAIDETRGLVALVVVFDHPAKLQSVEVKGLGEVEVGPVHRSPNSMLIAELFKVRGGEIVHVEAVLEGLPYGAKPGWERSVA